MEAGIIKSQKRRNKKVVEREKFRRYISDSASDYHYVILFPVPHINLDSCRRLKYETALRLFVSCVNGGEGRLEEAKNDFQNAWMNKFRSTIPDEDDLVPFESLQELVRQMIISRLEAIEGISLNIHTTKRGNAVVCMIRGTRQLFATEAHRIGLRVQVWPEVDPGYEYWSDRRNIVKDNLEISRSDAQTLLHRMFLEGKIHGEEAQIFPDESPYMWTKRINVLLRTTDPVLQSNTQFPLYFPYINSAKLQHLYKTIDGNHSRMPFRIIDKIRLIKSIIDQEFSCGKLQHAQFILGDFCLHTYETEDEDACLDGLNEEWGSFAAPYRILKSTTIPWTKVLSYQPLHQVRDYFGEEIALYFAYLGFFAKKTLWLLGIGTLSLFIRSVSSRTFYEEYSILFALSNCLWSIWAVRLWERKEKSLAVKWGSFGIKEEQLMRPEFKGMLRISPITNREEPFFNPRERFLLQILSWFITFFCILVLLSTIWGIFHVEYLLNQRGWTSCSFACHVVLALLIPIVTPMYSKVAHALNNWENYRTQAAYDHNLTLKHTVFDTFNQYAALLFIVFAKGRTYGCNLGAVNEDELSCMDEVQQLLLIIFFFTFINCAKEIITPILQTIVTVYRGEESNEMLLRKDDVEAQTDLDPYHGVLHDYARIMIFFGYLCLFGCSTPFAPFAIYLLTNFQVRVDAYKMCHRNRRPFPKQTEDIGGWRFYLIMLSFIGIFVNSGIVVLTSSLFADVTPYDQLFYFIMTVFVFGSFWGIVLLWINPTPDDVAISKQRQDYLQDKHLHGFEDLDEGVDDSIPYGWVLLNGVFRHYITASATDEAEVLEIQKTLEGFQQEKQEQITLIEQVGRASGDCVGKLRVYIVGINILPKIDRFGGSTDPFVKIHLLRDEKRVPKISFKTAYKPKNRSPIWNEEFIVPIIGIDSKLEFTVYHKQTLGKDKQIASCLLPSVDMVNVFEEREISLPLQIPSKLTKALQNDIKVHGEPKLSIKVTFELSQLGEAQKRLQEIEQSIKEYETKLLDYLEW